MARKRKRPDYDNLTSAEIAEANAKLRAYLAKRAESDPLWSALTALTPAQRAQLMGEFRALVDGLCSQSSDPLPPLRPGDGAGIADETAAWLAGGGAL